MSQLLWELRKVSLNSEETTWFDLMEDNGVEKVRVANFAVRTDSKGKVRKCTMLNVRDGVPLEKLYGYVGSAGGLNNSQRAMLLRTRQRLVFSKLASGEGSTAYFISANPKAGTELNAFLATPRGFSYFFRILEDLSSEKAEGNFSPKRELE